MFESAETGHRLARSVFERELPRLRKGLIDAQYDWLTQAPAALLILIHGMDAAGKGETLNMLNAWMDARHISTWGIGKPSAEEKRRPEFWRFWRHVPPRGRIAIFDRSWYGRVLVERVEGFATPAEWLRAYGEINDFETELTMSGILVAKYWLAISHREQLARFRAREKTGYKKYKITPEDWRNRAKWDAYQRAACDMIDRTSTELAPWVLVEAEDKHYARIKVLKDLCRRIEAQL